jgi:hypothetical protein
MYVHARRGRSGLAVTPHPLHIAAPAKRVLLARSCILSLVLLFLPRSFHIARLQEFVECCCPGTSKLATFVDLGSVIRTRTELASAILIVLIIIAMLPTAKSI